MPSKAAHPGARAIFRAVRYALIAVVLAACGHPPDPRHGGGAGGAGSATAGGSNVKPQPGHASTNPDPNLPEAHEVPCPTPTCAFHAGGGAYSTCLAGGAGTCFHFGGHCTPPDSCMFDPNDRTYKSCKLAVEGTCQTWAAACEPQSKCMFDPGDGLHHHCDDASGGTCKRWGALCAP
jgi:hypothetical protein